MKRKSRWDRGSGGFTLAELLIVVAIIAVLVAISIPIFSNQLEKSREAVDLANVRNAYAEVMSAAMTEDTTSASYDTFSDEYVITVYLKQKKNNWTMNADKLSIGEVAHSDKSHWKGDAKARGRCEVRYSNARNDITLIWDGYTVYPNYQWKITNGKLSKDNVSYNAKNWPCSAMPEFINAKNDAGQQLVVTGISDQTPNLKEWIDSGHGYEIGYFITDHTGKILYDSKGIYLKAGSDSVFDINIGNAEKDQEVNIAVQFFKMNSATDHSKGSTEMTEAEARELERLFTLKGAEETD